MPKNKIMGNMLGMPSPRSDWNETNPLKGSFILNKPIIPIVDTELDYDSSNAVSNSAVVRQFISLDEVVTHIANDARGARNAVDNIMNGVNTVPSALNAYSAFADDKGLVIHETYATKEELYPNTVTVVPTTLVPNTAYNFGSVENLTLSFPTEANDGDVIYVTFRSDGVNPTNLVVNTLNLHDDFDLIPESGLGYEIYAKFIDGFWLAKYSEYVPNSYVEIL